MTPPDDGWAWFDGAPSAGPEGPFDPDALPAVFARCFRGADAETVLAYLRALTVERALAPSASDAALRHLEGQRQLVAHLLALVERGRAGG